MSDLNQPPTSRDPAVAEKADKLVSAVRELGVPSALERSFKLFVGAMLENRFLIGFRPKAVGGEARIVGLCDRLGMPEPLRDPFRRSLPEATVVLVGFEEGGDGCLYKAYLEFGGGFERVQRSDRLESFTVHRGFKWDPSDPTRHATARYTCYPTLGLTEMLERLEVDFYRDHPETLRLVRRIATLAESRTDHDHFLYAEVEEENNPRRSYDMNLYEARLTLRELRGPVSALFAHYAIPEEDFERIYASFAPARFGHLSGGTDRRGRDFITIYFCKHS